MAHRVNLDALIPREDFEYIDPNSVARSRDTIAISELEEGKIFLNVLRKPDFQRETCEWTPDKVCALITSFLNDDLIPAIILWNSNGRNFVIDGAHRLSALIAWVIDDYGDGVISNGFFNHQVSPEQKKVAIETQNLIKRKIGTYKDHIYALNNSAKSDPEMVARAQRLANLVVTLQWVKGDASKAETSFFKINEEAAAINDTERLLLKSRTKPNAIAARAIVRAGTGHEYWSKFNNDKKEEIKLIAKEVNELLFLPTLEMPFKNLDIPLAGKGYSSETLSLIFDLINICTNIEKSGSKRAKKDTEVTFNQRKSDGSLVEVNRDIDGAATIAILIRAKKIVSLVLSDEIYSLGLHPYVYFYTPAGKYQITSFFAIIELMKDFEKNNYFISFLTIREGFESFLLEYKIFVNQTTLKHGSGVKGYKPLKKLYQIIIDKLLEKKDNKTIVAELLKSEDYAYLNPNDQEFRTTNRANFSTSAKSAIVAETALASLQKCPLCHGYINPNSFNIDHKKDVKFGGKGNVENGQMTHYYCNSVKDKLVQMGIYTPSK